MNVRLKLAENAFVKEKEPGVELGSFIWRRLCAARSRLSRPDQSFRSRAFRACPSRRYPVGMNARRVGGLQRVASQAGDATRLGRFFFCAPSRRSARFHDDFPRSFRRVGACFGEVRVRLIGRLAVDDERLAGQTARERSDLLKFWRAKVVEEEGPSPASTKRLSFRPSLTPTRRRRLQKGARVLQTRAPCSVVSPAFAKYRGCAARFDLRKTCRLRSRRSERSQRRLPPSAPDRRGLAPVRYVSVVSARPSSHGLIAAKKDEPESTPTGGR